GDRPEDPRLPREERRLRFGRRPRRRVGHRPGATRHAARPGCAVSRIAARAGPHVLLAALCVGLAGANAARLPVAPGSVAAGLLLAASGAAGEYRLAVLAAALALAGLVWGGARLDALDRSPLSSQIGHAGRALLVVTGPARHSPFDVRVPAEA